MRWRWIRRRAAIIVIVAAVALLGVAIGIGTIPAWIALAVGFGWYFWKWLTDDG